MKREWDAVSTFSLLILLEDMHKYVRWSGNVYWGLNVSYFQINRTLSYILDAFDLGDQSNKIEVIGDW